METHTHRSYTFGTWNVRGLCEKKREAFSEIRRESEDVVVLTETKLRGIGEEVLEDYIHLYSGISSGLARAGVSILVKKELANNFKWASVSERLIMAKLKISGRSVVIIGVYWLDDCAKPAMKDSFQSSLKSIVESVDKEHELVILGDFNSRVGKDSKSAVVGSYGESEINNNGRRLTDLCKDLGLKIQNTFFNHEDKHKYTWYHPRQSRRTLIDFCITRQDSSFLVEDVVACRWLQCGTDHVFLEATLSFQLQGEDVLPVEQEDIVEKYRTYLLYSKTIRTSYKDYLETAIDLSVPRSTEGMYQCLKDCIHSAASHVLGSERKDQFGEFLWDQEIRDLREFRQRKNDQSETDMLFLGKTITEPQFRNVKNEVWEGICSAIDNTDKYRRNKVVWDIVNDLQNKYPRTLKTHSERFVYEISCKEDTNDSKEPTSPIDSLSTSNELNSDNIIHINIHDVCKALEHLEDCNVSVPGGLTIKLLRHSSNKCKILLKNLMQNIFNGDEIPTEITEMYCTTDIVRVNGEIIVPNIGNCFMHSIMRVMRVILKNVFEKYVSFEDIRQVTPVESYLDATFILRQILQKSMDKQNPPFHFVFIDLINSFFDIEYSKLFEFLAKESIPHKLITVIKHLYQENNIRIIKSGRLLEGPCLNKGLTYDFSLSCMLLKMYLKKTLKAWSAENLEHGVAIGNEILLSLFLSDAKLVIVSGNKANMELIITSLGLHLLNIGLGLNLKNVEYLGKENLEIDNTTIEGKDVMNFHDSIFELDGRNVQEIFQRIVDTKEAIGILHPVARDEIITKQNKRRIFRSIIRSLLVYGCETWTITEDLKRPFEDAELSYWKWCCEYYPQRFTKQEIYDLMNVKEAVSRIIMLKKAAWYTNIMETDNAGWVRNILDWEPNGVLRCGRPRKKWADGLEDFLKSFQDYRIFFQKNKQVRRHNMLTTIKNYIVDSDKIPGEDESDLQP